MRNVKCFFILTLLQPACLFAQQPAWELVRQDFWGKIAVDPTNSDIIYVSPGTSPGFGIYKSTDGGKTWMQYLTGYEGLGAEGIVIDPQNPQRLWLFGGEFTGIIRSENGGMTAVKADTGIIYDHHGYSVTALAYDPIRDILYAGDTAISGGIYRSFDGGQRWEQVQTYGQGLMFNPTFFWLEADSGWIYSGTSGHGIWRSKNSGVTWAPLDPQVLGGLPLGEPIYFITKTSSSRTLYAASLLGNIYKSYDLGEHWVFISDATANSDILTGGFAISYIDSNYIYVGGRPGTFPSGKGGLYLSRDGGKSWQLYHAGLPQYDSYFYHVGSLIQTPDTKYLYISLRSLINSIYRLPQALLTSIQKDPLSSFPPNFSLQQNYPNPFNTQTQIEFSVKKKERITLDVYNLTGEHVVNLINEVMDPGKHFTFWNGKNSKGGDVVSGIYLCRLRAEGEILIRKLLLIR